MKALAVSLIALIGLVAVVGAFSKSPVSLSAAMFFVVTTGLVVGLPAMLVAAPIIVLGRWLIGGGQGRERAICAALTAIGGTLGVLAVVYSLNNVLHTMGGAQRIGPDVAFGLLVGICVISYGVWPRLERNSP